MISNNSFKNKLTHKLFVFKSYKNRIRHYITHKVWYALKHQPIVQSIFWGCEHIIYIYIYIYIYREREREREFMCFKQEGAISILRSKPLKWVKQSTCLSSNISSTESKERRWLLSRGCRSKGNLISDKIKRDFFPSCGRVSTTEWMHCRDSSETHGEKFTQRFYLIFWTNPGSGTP